MEDNISISSVHLHNTGHADFECLIIPCFKDGWSSLITSFGKVTTEHCQQILSDEDFHGSSAEIVIIHRAAGSGIKKICFVGLGEQANLTFSTLVSTFNKVLPSTRTRQCGALHILLPKYTPQTHLIYQATVRAFSDFQYVFKGYKTINSYFDVSVRQKLILLCEQTQDLNRQLKYWSAESAGIRLAKDLANAAANDCTPVMLAEQAKKIGSRFHSISTKIVSKNVLKKLNMNAYLAVNAGSMYDATMPVMHYRGAPSTLAPIVLIGKGVTLDTGGISLKRGDGIHHMIYDMAGAAVVMGLMVAVAKLKLPINLIGVIASAENAIDGASYRPGDVIKTASGQTVEVISTDAEGRMLIADALTYVEQFSPRAVIDIATLTGAAITATGHVCSGLLSNQQVLESALIEAGKSAQDKLWAFPLWEEYFEAIESSCADMKNAGTNSPGMITAGCFLSNFAKKYAWAHLDVAGTAFEYGKQNTATGRPLPMLLDYLHNISYS